MTLLQTDSDPKSISGYRILREVGRGGVATVYLAVQESLRREVALKIMAPALTNDPNFTSRFIHEGLTIAQLNHPGIVTIYDISVSGREHYIAMEFLRGGSLKGRIQQGMPAGRALDTLRQVAAALKYAHDAGVVHRDVKPENIMFRDAKGSEAVLTDFGIAKTETERADVTRAGLVVGTPRYMSPEQAEGRGATARSDIYALGVVLFEMLTGRPPYVGAESLAVLHSHLNEPVPELPRRLRSLQPLLDDMMAKDPGKRVPDCGSLLVRVEELIGPGGGTLGAAGLAPADDRRTAPRLSRGAAGLALGGVVLAGIVLAAALIGKPSRQADDDAIGGSTLPEGDPPIIVVPRKIDLTEGGGPPPEAGTADGSDEGGEEGIAALLRKGDRQLGRDRLTTPAGDNALETFSAVLELRPGDARAENGLMEIAARYEEFARAKLDAGELGEADAFARSGLRAWPAHRGLHQLREEVALRRAGPPTDRTPAETDPLYAPLDAAQAGNAAVQFQLGLAFANGTGVDQDARQALQWFGEAARRGHVKASYNLALGLMFGPQPDPDSAGQWMASAADADYKPAYRVLGWMFTTGTGVRKNAKNAVIWSAKGAKWSGPPDASEVAAPWQEAFEAAYWNAVISKRDQRMAKPQDLK